MRTKTLHETLRLPVLLGALLLIIPGLSAAPEVGKAAPDFTLPGSKGEEHTLSDFKGKYVVLEWLNHGCPFVVKHYATNNMQTLQKDYTEKNVIWLSIISSAPGKQGHMTAEQAKETFESKSSAATEILLDPEGTVGKLYNARTTPEMFVINPEGILIYMGAIDDNSGRNHAAVAKATNYVKAALDAAMAGKEVEVSATKPYGCSVKYP